MVLDVRTHLIGDPPLKHHFLGEMVKITAFQSFGQPKGSPFEYSSLAAASMLNPGQLWCGNTSCVVDA